MIFTQRPQIGILKALGYSNRQIVIYYASFAIIIGLVGAILGTVFGLLLCGIMTQAYAMYFNLPTYTASYNLSTISYGFLLSLSVALAAGWLAARKVTAIHPAEAMRPELPQAKGKSSNGLLLSRFRLPLEWKMSIRSISRNRGRFALTMVGVTFSVGLLIIAFSFNDMIDNMMNDYFYNSQSYDLLVRFDKVLREHDLTAVEQIDGVLKVEPFIEIPVRIHYQGRKEEDILVGYGRNMTLKTIKINNQSTSIIPEDGIVLAERTAKKLGVSIGDVVEVETLMLVGPPYRETIRVIGESEQMIGGLSYINLLRANQIFNERSLVSGAMLQVERGKTEEVEQQLNEMLTISAIISPDKEIKTFEDNLGAVVYAVSIMVIFAFILGFAIVFNTSLMNFLERKRELASLKVMGFSRKELSRLLLNESIIQSGLGILLGLPFGKILAHYYIASVETDMYSFQAAVYPLTYFYAAASATVFVLIAHRLAVRDLKNINLVEALKNKD
jgi:putative ABC transport system permease protein